MSKNFEHPSEQKSPEKAWARWKEVVANKPQDVKYAIREGRALGIAEEEIQQFAEQELAARKKEGWSSLAYAIMNEANLGTEEERAEMGEKAYQGHLKNKNPLGASRLAEKLWGTESAQYRAAREQLAKEQEEAASAKTEPLMRLPHNPTFQDFAFAWHAMINEEGSGIDIEIEEDLKRIMGEEGTKQLMAFLKGETTNLADKRITPFFRKYGLGKRDLEEIFGIEFKKQKK